MNVECLNRSLGMIIMEKAVEQEQANLPFSLLERQIIRYISAVPLRLRHSSCCPISENWGHCFTCVPAIHGRCSSDSVLPLVGYRQSSISGASQLALDIKRGMRESKAREDKQF